MNIVYSYCFLKKIFFLGCLFSFLFNTIPLKAYGADKLKIGVPENIPPFLFYEENSETLKGYIVDMLQMLAEHIDSEVVLYSMDVSDQIKELNEGNLDFIVIFQKEVYPGTINFETQIIAEKRFFINRPYFNSDMYHGNDSSMVAIEKDNIDLWPKPMEGKVTLIETDSQEAALYLVNSGKVHAYLSGNHFSSEYIIRQNKLLNIKEGWMPIDHYPMVFTLREGDDELFTTLSTAYSDIVRDKSIDKVYNKWLGSSLRYFLIKYSKYAAIVVILIIATLFSSVLWNFTLKRKVARAVRDFQTSEQRYKDLIEFSPDIIFLVSKSGKIRLANKNSLSKLGYGENEILSLTLINLVLSEQKEDAESFISKVFKDNYSESEFTFVAKNGDSIRVDTAAILTKVIDESDDVCACCFSRDITERKRLEENLMHSDRLAVIGQMAAGIAHELNNPLGIILTNAEDLLYHEPDQIESNDNLRSIERNALRASEIIETLLSYTRPALLEKTQFNIDQLIDESLLFLKPRIKKKKIKIRKQYTETPVVLCGDEKMLQQLLVNIFLNSIHALDAEGEISITLNVINGDMGGRLVLKIADNGKGIPEGDIDKIFDAFFTSQKNKGFGLGLFISKIIVEKHGGEINIQSIEGKETVVNIYFPIEASLDIEPDEYKDKEAFFD